MQFFRSVIGIICILKTSECSLFDQVDFESIDEGAQILLNDLSAPLVIRINLQEVVKRNKADFVVVSDTETHHGFPESTHLIVSKWKDECISINYSSNHEATLMASIKLNVYMYGGAEDNQGDWPLKKPYWEEEFLTRSQYASGVMEPYHLLSNGYYIYVDNRVPLFVSSEKDILQLKAKKSPLYIKHEKLALNFTVCKLGDVYQAQLHAIKHFLGKPKTLPDERLVTYPAWSTEGKFSQTINQSVILSFAQDIAEHNFSGQLRIDKTWEECPGSLKPNGNFLTFKDLIIELKKFNFTVALAIDAYVSPECNETYKHGIENNYFVKNGQNVTSVNGQPDGNRFIDLTNPAAHNWYLERLQNLRKTYGIDTFSLNDVYSSSPPQPPIYYTMAEDHPETIVKESAKLLASLGSNGQTMAARNTQKYGIFVRMEPRSTAWNEKMPESNKNTGLTSVIPTLLQLNIVGYSFVVPDKIGGHGGYEEILKKSELFIRWIQLNVFMPCMEFAIPPSDFDAQVLLITTKFIDLHKQYSHQIYQLMEEHKNTGAPVNRPLWWIAPNDDEALKCDNEFLLGDDILVAPVLVEGARNRDIYLPAGVWKDENSKSDATIKGPTWLQNFTAGLETLPYFRRISPN